VSGPTTQRPGEAESPKTRELETELEEISARHQGEYGILLWHPESGTRVAVGAGERFKAASLAKLPVLLALYGEAAEGRIDLAERVRMSEADIQSSTGALQNLPPGTHLMLRECAEYLMRESDNTAWSMLENRQGKRRIRSEPVTAGARSTN
jgi:beta-lactamase class A